MRPSGCSISTISVLSCHYRWPLGLVGPPNKVESVVQREGGRSRDGGHTNVFSTETKPLEAKLKLNNILCFQIDVQPFQVKLLASPKSTYLACELL